MEPRIIIVCNPGGVDLVYSDLPGSVVVIGNDFNENFARFRETDILALGVSFDELWHECLGLVEEYEKENNG